MTGGLGAKGDRGPQGLQGLQGLQGDGNRGIRSVYFSVGGFGGLLGYSDALDTSDFAAPTSLMLATQISLSYRFGDPEVDIEERLDRWGVVQSFGVGWRSNPLTKAEAQTARNWWKLDLMGIGTLPRVARSHKMLVYHIVNFFSLDKSDNQTPFLHFEITSGGPEVLTVTSGNFYLLGAHK